MGILYLCGGYYLVFVPIVAAVLFVPFYLNFLRIADKSKLSSTDMLISLAVQILFYLAIIEVVAVLLAIWLKQAESIWLMAPFAFAIAALALAALHFYLLGRESNAEHIQAKIGKMKARRNVEGLIRMLNSRDYNTRQAAVDALVEIATPSVEQRPIPVNEIFILLCRGIPGDFVPNSHVYGIRMPDLFTFWRARRCH
jgi:hypothetical protein